MIQKKATRRTVGLLLVLCGLPLLVHAKIYRSQDAHGTWIISETPPAPGTAPAPVNSDTLSRTKPPLTRETAQEHQASFHTAREALRTLETRWHEALHGAMSPAPQAPASQLAQMHSIKRDTVALPVPPCLVKPKQTLLESMEADLAYAGAVRRDPQYAPGAGRGRKLYGRYLAQLQACKA